MTDAWKEAQKVLRGVTTPSYQKTVKGIGVDSGMILIADKDFFETSGGTSKIEKRLSKSFSLPRGTYSVRWSIPESWKGVVSGSGELKVTSGTVLVTDPGYLLGDVWDWFLDKYNFGKRRIPGAITLNKMGGDGVYKVIMTITKKSR